MYDKLKQYEPSPEEQALIYADCGDYAKSRITFLTLLNYWKIRYRETARAEAKRILSRSGLSYETGDIDYVEANTWSLIAEWYETGEARTLLKKTLIRNLKGVLLSTAPECECSVRCDCSKSEPHTVCRCIFFAANHAAESWRTERRRSTRDQTASNAKQKSRREAEKRGQLFEPVPKSKDEPNGTPTFPQTLDLGYKAKQRLETVIDDHESSEPLPDDDADEPQCNNWTAMSLRPGPSLMLAMAHQYPDSTVMAYDSGEILDAKRKKHAKPQPITYGERFTSVLNAWRFAAPIRQATPEEWDLWTNQVPVIFATDKRTSVGASSALEWTLDNPDARPDSPSNPYATGKRERPVTEGEKEDDSSSFRESAWAYHPVHGRIKIFRILEDPTFTWIEAKKKKVLVRTADICDKPLRKPQMPKAA